MKICAAQIKPLKGDIPANIQAHKRLIALAVLAGADAIFFPELSLTGYEPLLAENLATNKEGERLNIFQQISDTNNITIGVGLPTKAKTGILISMIIFQPGKSRLCYSKQQLHADELLYFVCGNHQITFFIGDKKVAPAICYESLQEDHIKNAAKSGAEIYIASAAKSQKGIDKALAYFPHAARKYSMTILLANCVGYCDNFESAGNSSVWTNEGKLAGQLNNTEEGLLLFNTNTGECV